MNSSFSWQMFARRANICHGTSMKYLAAVLPERVEACVEDFV